MKPKKITPEMEVNYMRKAIGKTFREMAESSRITQKKIAERLGVTATTVRNWMKEDVYVPQLVMEWIEKIDRAVNGKIH